MLGTNVNQDTMDALGDVPDADADLLVQAAYWKRYYEIVGTPSGPSVGTRIIPLVERMARELDGLRQYASHLEKVLNAF